MNPKLSSRAKLWVGLTLAGALLAFSVPFASGASNLFQVFPAPDDLPEGVEPVATGQKAAIASGETSDLDWRLRPTRATMACA